MNMNGSGSMTMDRFSYDDDVVKRFLMAMIFWAFVAMSAGVFIALQLANYKLNLGLPWTTFGRLRPIHTNAAIFAFAGNCIFAGIYYSTQRLLKARMFSDVLSKTHFWGWQLIIVWGAVSLLLGQTTGKEYAELEWPLDIAITLIWVVFAINFFGTFFVRRERHIYVALWFYIASILTVAVLHIVNSLSIPLNFGKSYSIYGGIQDALVQWWYGHNAVAFFLTTPFLGMMYYFLPKAADRPVYSYRLSIVHFWSLVFLYIWAGPHHLLYTSLPEWAQTLGMIFSVMLWAPSWGGMINGLLTLKGAWNQVRAEPILKFWVAALTFYGMATFEGPLLSIKSVNALSHYTDWTIGHVHSGALGWNGFVAFALTYWLVPRLWKTKLYSTTLANTHFWLGIVGIILYVLSMWVAGITQGLMWKSIIPATGKLAYPDFMETVIRIVPLYYVRALGGGLFLLGLLLMIYNIWKTIKTAPQEKQAPTIVSVPRLSSAPISELEQGIGKNRAHRLLEAFPMVFTALTLVAVLIGGAVEITPLLISSEAIPMNSRVKPYRALELHGRDIYVREGCYVCHSQQIRPMEAELLRYGKFSTVEESQYDRPFQWGSKRTGPDLARVGIKYPDLWHYRHMLEPRDVSPNSIMPSYGWLYEKEIDFGSSQKKFSIMYALGVPYTKDDLLYAETDAKVQAEQIAKGLYEQGVKQNIENKEIVALIAYLQRLGKESIR